MATINSTRGVRRERLFIRWAAKAGTTGGSDACWPWMASMSTNGYGQITINGRTELAHRAAWRLFRGSIPRGMYVCHNCADGSDTRACVNPSHLFVGTSADNVADRDAKGRSARGESHGNSRLTARDVADIRTRRSAGEKRRSIAQRFGIAAETVTAISRGHRWRHVL